MHYYQYSRRRRRTVIPLYNSVRDMIDGKKPTSHIIFKTKENKMDNYFMLDGAKTKMSDDTADSLRKKRDEKSHIIAAISPGRDARSCDRLILYLDDSILAEKYKGQILSLDNNGDVAYILNKKIFPGRPMYPNSAIEEQIFPILE